MLTEIKFSNTTTVSPRAARAAYLRVLIGDYQEAAEMQRDELKRVHVGSEAHSAAMKKWAFYSGSAIRLLTLLGDDR